MKKFMVVIAVVSFVFMASVCSAQSGGRIFQVAVYCDNRLEHPSLTTTSEFVGDTGRGELGAMYKCELEAYSHANIKSVEFTNVEKELTFKIKQGLEVVAPGFTLWEYGIFFGQSEEDVLGKWKCTVKYKDQPDEIFLLTVNDILRLPGAEGFRAWFEGGTWNVALRANIGLPPPPSSPPTNVQYLLRVFNEDMHTIAYENRSPIYDGRENLVVFAGIPAMYSGYILRTEARLYGFGAAVAPGQVPEIRSYFSRSLLWARLP